jgi:hypothetical protein
VFSVYSVVKKCGGSEMTLFFKFELPDGMVEMAFNPLTGSVSEEAAYLR